MNTQYSRIRCKRTSSSGVIPTIPSTDNHLDGSWLVTDLYDGEMFINTADQRFWFRAGSNIVELFTAATSDVGFGSINYIEAADTIIINEKRQNLVFGNIYVQGSLTNNGELVSMNGDLIIFDDGEVTGTGDILITNFNEYI